MTVEFWFKLGSVSGYTAQRSHIFSLTTENEQEAFFEIGIIDNVLTCLPFGSYREVPFGQPDPTPSVTLPEFSADNESFDGWWHLTCSYSYRGYVKASLYNEENLNAVKSVRLTRASTEGLSLGRTGPLYGVFGKRPESSLISKLDDLSVQGGFMIKEFRLWIDQLDFEQIYTHRSSQLDPAYFKNEKLFYYLRLSTSDGGLTGEKNFARFNPRQYTSPDVDTGVTSFSGCSYEPDFKV
jgi:hypothetical protein